MFELKKMELNVIIIMMLKLLLHFLLVVRRFCFADQIA